MYLDLRATYPLLFSDFNAQIPNFTKIRIVGEGLVHADGRTDGVRTERQK